MCILGFNIEKASGTSCNVFFIFGEKIVTGFTKKVYMIYHPTFSRKIICPPSFQPEGEID
jgi:hypothetical protein